MNEKQTKQSINDISLNDASPNDISSNDISKMRPTKKQRELLTYIEGFITEHGYSPSYREIMNGLQYTSVATVSLHVTSLIKRGHLRKRDRSARSLEVVEPTNQPEAKLKTNVVADGEEKWLVEKIEQAFADVEATTGELPSTRVDGLYVLVGALRVLGLEGAAQSFIPRLAKFKKRQSS